MKAAWLRWALGAAVLLFLFFDTENFFRSPLWSRLVPCMSIPVGLGLGVWYWLRRFRGLEGNERFWMPIAAPAAAIGIIWVLLGHCVPARFTAFFGEPVRFTAGLETVHLPNSRRCRSRIYGKPFDVGVFNFFCANREMIRQLPALGYVDVIGRRSWFGLHAIEVVPQNAHRPTGG